MSITYYDFKNLSKESQYKLVSAEGVVISETHKNKLKFILEILYGPIHFQFFNSIIFV
ncbi:hypothetical protein J2787_000815 [Chryseobacterium rhizosphaerae]|uniref:Uncharacterized protein n=1 Tax=Chryseobacterium rhizosphaerae TaxID=395937 RepID=A0AAE3Y5P6_9FLAO|nr:hypothetical protein [Chryseobacterium rhizosphaerae]